MNDENRRRRKRAAKAGKSGTQPRHSESRSGVPVSGRPGRSAKLFYIIGVIIIAGSLVGSLLVAQLDGPDGGGDDARASDQLGTTSPPAPAATPATGGTVTSKTYSAPPPMAIDPKKTYTAVIETEKGDITIRLRPDLAPQHVNSFVFLANEGFYDNTTFHRVITGFMAQGGDPTGTGSGGPGYSVKAEFSSTSFDRGIVGAARSQNPDSAGSQFFITYERAAHLDRQYTVFGEVTSGMDVALAITPRDPASARTPGDKIVSIHVTES